MEKLKEKITALGDKIKALKSTSAAEVDKEAIGAAVQELLDLKGHYAALNNGIGVDGKPYEDPSKKKKKEKGPTATAAINVKPVPVRSGGWGVFCFKIYTYQYNVSLTSTEPTSNYSLHSYSPSYVHVERGSQLCQCREKGGQKGCCQGEKGFHEV
jgi:hypothetical protein